MIVEAWEVQPFQSVEVEPGEWRTVEAVAQTEAGALWVWFDRGPPRRYEPDEQVSVRSVE